MTNKNDTSQVLMAIANDINTLAIQYQALIQLLLKKEIIKENDFNKEIQEVVDNIKKTLVSRKIITPDGRMIPSKIAEPKEDNIAVEKMVNEATNIPEEETKDEPAQ
jgi:hypothetical protein